MVASTSEFSKVKVFCQNDVFSVCKNYVLYIFLNVLNVYSVYTVNSVRCYSRWCIRGLCHVHFAQQLASHHGVHAGKLLGPPLATPPTPPRPPRAPRPRVHTGNPPNLLLSPL